MQQYVVPQEEMMLNFKETMQYLKVSRSTLYRIMWEGKLPGNKVGSTWRFYLKDLRACIQNGAQVEQKKDLSVVGR
jgi:excisionase family DNA binding protein